MSTNSPQPTRTPAATDEVTHLDALIIGAGVAGLYQLHRLREMGMKVRAYETGTGIYRLMNMQGIPLPSNRIELAELVWERAGKPEPQNMTDEDLYADIDAADTDAQQGGQHRIHAGGDPAGNQHAGKRQDGADRQVNAPGQDHEGHAKGDQGVDRNLAHDVQDVVERQEVRRQESQHNADQDQRNQRRQFLQYVLVVFGEHLASSGGSVHDGFLGCGGDRKSVV